MKTKKKSAPEPLIIDGKFKCPVHGCLKEPWSSPEAYIMHWHRAHGRMGPQAGSFKSAAPRQLSTGYDPKKAHAYYVNVTKVRRAKARLAKSHRGHTHPKTHTHNHTKASGTITIDLASLGTEFLKTCPVCQHEIRLECGTCHTPLEPIIEGIKRALEERMKHHATES